MRPVRKMLVPTDLSEDSRRGLVYALALAEDNRSEVVVIHVANEFDAWELHSEDFGFLNPNSRAWPPSQIVAEATLDLNRFLEKHLPSVTVLPYVKIRVTLGRVADQIISVAEEEMVDLIVMSPRRRTGLKRFIPGATLATVMREAPCPILSVTPPNASRHWRGKLIGRPYSPTARPRAHI